MKRYEDPLALVDVTLFTIREGRLSLLLATRKNRDEPYFGALALPGGVIHTDEDENAQDAASRVVRTKLGFDPPYMEQLYTFSGRLRDPRRWSLSVAYYSLVPESVLEQTQVEGLEFVPADRIPDLPFDHNEIAAMAIRRLRSKSTYSSLLTFLLPSEFTIPELHAVYEQVTGSATNIAAFRKKVLDEDMIEATGERRKGGQHRAPDLYRRKGNGLQELKRTI
ncbi:NUDIX domain-containing protein [Massilia sp. IC2-278]|uniref:NUDIX hydrolase n=1 Tax=Massilia sp. IC2-278 TaxID=2887200 RepID=UPI001E4088EF|nr:NUDIX domain-containing protein [Massilia sp. IC2-278]MCC2960572.1 NUDIX domain-containing protein [Massilia sp. IC2-278]